MDEPITHVEHVCPKCWMSVKPPVTRENSVTWVEGRTRYYGHARCYEVPQEEGGVDNGGTMVATD
jgi:hypothetical protein